MTLTEAVPVWLDCDPGHDDAFAILLAAWHPSFRLLGVSTVHGNASLSRTTDNALSVLKAIAKDEIAVFPGTPKPFCRAEKHAPSIHGESGLDGTDLLPEPDRRALTHCNAIKEMRDTLMSCLAQSAWLVATGTLTNVALLFTTFPEVAKNLKGLSIMGGAVGEHFTDVHMGPPYVNNSGQKHERVGNMTPFAEFNIWCDPEAAQSIFSNPELSRKTSLITLDLTHQVLATKEVRDMLLRGREDRAHPTRLRRMFHELLMFFAHTYEEVFGLSEGPPLHDPVAVAVLLDRLAGGSESLFEDAKHERWHVHVETAGEEEGRTRVSASDEGVFIPRTLQLGRFWDIIEDCMAKADAATRYATI